MPTEETKTVDVFCAKCQETTPHTEYIDANNELVMECSKCKHFVKLPAEIHTDEGAKADFLQNHANANNLETRRKENESRAQTDSLIPDKEVETVESGNSEVSA